MKIIIDRETYYMFRHFGLSINGKDRKRWIRNRLHEPELGSHCLVIGCEALDGAKARGKRLALSCHQAEPDSFFRAARCAKNSLPLIQPLSGRVSKMEFLPLPSRSNEQAGKSHSSKTDSTTANGGPLNHPRASALARVRKMVR